MRLNVSCLVHRKTRRVLFIGGPATWYQLARVRYLQDEDPPDPPDNAAAEAAMVAAREAGSSTRPIQSST